MPVVLKIAYMHIQTTNMKKVTISDMKCMCDALEHSEAKVNEAHWGKDSIDSKCSVGHATTREQDTARHSVGQLIDVKKDSIVMAH